MKRHFGKWLTAAALAVGCTVMTANAFADTDGHWAESAINKWSGEYGIIQGYDDGTFRPDKSITRGAFAGIFPHPAAASKLRSGWPPKYCCKKYLIFICPVCLTV